MEKDENLDADRVNYATNHYSVVHIGCWFLFPLMTFRAGYIMLGAILLLLTIAMIFIKNSFRIIYFNKKGERITILIVLIAISLLSCLSYFDAGPLINKHGVVNFSGFDAPLVALEVAVVVYIFRAADKIRCILFGEN